MDWSTAKLQSKISYQEEVVKSLVGFIKDKSQKLGLNPDEITVESLLKLKPQLEEDAVDELLDFLECKKRAEAQQEEMKKELEIRIK